MCLRPHRAEGRAIVARLADLEHTVPASRIRIVAAGDVQPTGDAAAQRAFAAPEGNTVEPPEVGPVAGLVVLSEGVAVGTAIPTEGTVREGRPTGIIATEQAATLAEA